jgi:asparagine synthase (glutamine-hydrolysing)
LLKVVLEVNDEMMANAKFRFPQNTPQNKEEYRYRTIFEEHFPSETAALTVPSVPSVACSTPIALEWDERLKQRFHLGNAPQK